MIFHSTSKKPILLVGNGARAAGAESLIIEFTKKTNIPIITTMNGVDLAQDDMKIGFMGVYGNRVANTILTQCDLIISVGARLSLRQVGKNPRKFAPQAKLIRVDIDPYEISHNIKDDEKKYLLDAKDFMKRLMQEEIPDYSEWHDKCFKAKKLFENCDKEIGNMVIEEINKLLPLNPIVAVDVGQSQCWSAQSLSLKGYLGRILIGGGYGSMGCGLPYAIGASIAQSKKVVYCITGDGGLQMNIQELETVKRENLPVKMLVLNNYALGKIREVQYMSYESRFAGTTSDSGYTVPDFEKIAQAYGIKACTISTYKKLGNYKDWLYDDEPCLINIQMPEDTLLIPKIKWETGKIEPAIDSDLEKEVIDLLK